MKASGKSSGIVRNPQDVVAGVLLIAVSAVVLSALSEVSIASYAAISPVLFPQMCTYGLAAGGGVLVLRGLVRDGPRLDGLPARPILLVTLSIVVFGMVAPSFGYGPAGFLAILIGGAATPEVRLRELVIFAILLTAFSIALFSYVLNLSIPILSIHTFRL